MPLSDQELRCVNLTLEYLTGTLGGPWVIKQNLDDEFHSEPTPEVVATNGEETCAIEVKRLTGDYVLQSYRESVLSNERYLAPTCGGFYFLYPPSGFRLPMDISLRRHIKQEIEIVAQVLKPGKSGAIRVYRKGHISLDRRSGIPMVRCYHGRMAPESYERLLSQMEGQFLLVDDGFDHVFVTEEGRNQFCDVLLESWARRLDGDASSFMWYEEWELERAKDLDDLQGDDDEDGVCVLAVSEPRDLTECTAETINAILPSALRKFAARRWADRHVLVLETSAVAPARVVTDLFLLVEPKRLQAIDLVLAVDGDNINQVYPVPA